MKHQKLALLTIAFTLHLFVQTSANSANIYPEKLYQNTWCKAHGGQSEIALEDKTRVDCIIPNYAIEFDFAKKWCEAIGQSLYYSYMTNKKAGIVLILEDKEKDQKYLDRLSKIAPKYGIKIWTMTPCDIKNATN